MKTRIMLIILVIIVVSTIGCAKQPAKEPAKETKPNVDTVTSASIVDNANAFEKAISKEGTWIIATLKDLTIDKDLVLEGDFKNDRGETQRKIALYTQDANRNITARFALTAPKLTIKSPEASIQHGTFKGDLYVDVNHFKLIDTKVEGNVYFFSEDVKSTFTIDEDSSVSGKQEVNE